MTFEAEIVEIDGGTFVKGFANKALVYISKRLKGFNHAAKLKQRWLRRVEKQVRAGRKL